MPCAGSTPSSRTGGGADFTTFEVDEFYLRLDAI
jgi:hypothetical protein